MSNDLNLCQFIGRLGADPDVRYSQGGKAVAKFNIACGQTWKDKDGNKQESTDWIRCTAFGKLAEIIGQYAKKGSQIYVAGRQQTSSYEKEGQKHYSTEIVVRDMQLLGSRQGGGDYESRAQDNGPRSKPADDFDDDSIPF